jgi:hypothetical protein
MLYFSMAKTTVLAVTLVRISAVRDGNMGGYRATEVTMVLTAEHPKQLANMVNIAAVDGWRKAA